MLFNSYTFLFLFLPVTLVGFLILGKKGDRRLATGWLVLASSFFYAWWNPRYIFLIYASVLFNYALGSLIKRTSSKTMMVLGVMANLGALGYFKYANFFIDTINTVTGHSFHVEKIILPLAISFFTFQQIAYLVDLYRGDKFNYNFLQYCLFVTFFPQLIAGPIVNHKEILPQFAKKDFPRVDFRNIAIGLTFFFIGLAKKVLLADKIAAYASPVFAAADRGSYLSFLEAWQGVFAYTFQIYFDFSGYSDMAIGLAFLFGIRIPLNFHSPYKAGNVIDFWRRWHMTLSRFLMLYLYIPLGGNRRGKLRRYLNLMATMLLCGLWHGAAWTFVLWGALHGIFIVTNHAWHALLQACRFKANSSWLTTLCSRSLTFLAIATAWVLFRAETLQGASLMLRSMFSLDGFALPSSYLSKYGLLASGLQKLGIPFSALPYFKGSGDVLFLLALLALTWLAPTTHQILGERSPAINIYREEIAPARPTWLRWQPSSPWMAALVVLMVLTILSMSNVSEFLYFQF